MTPGRAAVDGTERPPGAAAADDAALAAATTPVEAARRAPARPRPPVRLVALSLLIGAVFAGPLGYLVSRSVTLDADVGRVLTSSTTLAPLQRTLVLAVAVSASTAALGTGLAWLVTRSDVPLRRVWQVLIPLPLVIPSFVGAAALVAAFTEGGLIDELLEPLGADRLPRVQGFTGAFVVLTLLSYPYVFLPVAARLSSLPPFPEESARLLGRRPLEVFRTVVLPQTSGAIWAGTMLVFLYVLSDFGAVQIVRYDTLTRAIYSSRLVPETSIPLSLVLGMLAVAVVAVERLAGRRRAVTEGSRARRALRVPLGRWRVAAVAFLGATVGVALVGPLAVLGWWAGRGLLRGDAAAQALTTDLDRLVTPLLNSAGVGVVTAMVAVIVVLPVAELTVRHRSRVGDLPNALVVGGFALPGLVIALALGFWVLQLPEALGLYQTLPLLVLAYVVHFGAQAMRAAQIAVGGVPRRVEDAAQMLGAGRARRFATVEVPIMLPGLLAGAGMVLLSAMKELPATLLLAPTGFETLATRIWQANSEGFLAETGITSLVLVALSGILTWLLVIRRAATM